MMVSNWVCQKLSGGKREHYSPIDVKNLSEKLMEEPEANLFPFLPHIWTPGTDHDSMDHPVDSRRIILVLILQNKL